MTTQLFGAIKESRDSAIEVFTGKIRELIKDTTNDGHDVLFVSARAAIDKAISGTLDAVEEHYEEIIQVTSDDEDDVPDVNVTITSGLSELYFESVNN